MTKRMAELTPAVRGRLETFDVPVEVCVDVPVLRISRDGPRPVYAELLWHDVVLWRSYFDEITDYDIMQEIQALAFSENEEGHSALEQPKK